MEKNLTCFKCWQPTATLTYEENRVYKVACSCGCEYTFNHCSMTDALAYHNKMLELYGQIDANASLRTQLAEVTAERDALVEDLRSKADCTTCKYRAQKPGHGTCNHCGKEYSGWQWRGLRKEPDNANG